MISCYSVAGQPLAAPLLRRKFRFLVLLFASLLANHAFAQLRLVDDAGSVLQLASAPQRVVSLAPHLTELIFAVGAGETLVGTIEFSDYPNEAKRIPRIGNASGLDLERIVALRPQLIFAWGSGSPTRQVQKLRELGLPVYISETRRLADIAPTILKMGQILDRSETAQAVAQQFTRSLTDISRQHRGARTIELFYQVWSAPLTTIGGGHLINDVIRTCDGRNIFRQLVALAPVVSVEAVIASDPEAIIISAPMADAEHEMRRWRHWKHLRAVRNNNLVAVDPSVAQRATPRIIEGIRELCGKLQAIRIKNSG